MLVNNSLICLNILRNQNKSSHNMKTFEIPAMGGLLLTERNRDQNRFFPENQACVMYKDINELNYKINKIKNNFIKYDQIKKKGYKIAKNHSYILRAKYLMKVIYG